MSVWGIAMVKDEADIASQTVFRMTHQVDAVLVADNGSSDGTRELLEPISRVTVIDDPDPAYYQAHKMSHLARLAAQRGAEWVVPFDADEIWRGRGAPIRELLNGLPSTFLLAEAALYDHVATGADPDIADPVCRLQWRRPQCAPLPKVACRYREGLQIHQGNHGATYPDNDHPPTATNLLSIRHFPYRSIEQLIRKARNGAAAYAATDLPEDTGAHWRSYGAMSDEQLAEVFRKWYWRDDPTKEVTIEGEHQPALVHDPVR